MNILRNITELNKWIAANYLHEQAVCIDATCGNGNDTLFLAQRSKKVYGFDIQKEAIENTEKLLKDNGLYNVELFLKSHETMDECVDEQADVIMFNLGYLPKGDKSITTHAQSSLIALNKALNIIKTDGLICLILYYGHEEGKKERNEILQFVSQLDYQKYQVGSIEMINQHNDPPQIILITKKI